MATIATATVTIDADDGSNASAQQMVDDLQARLNDFPGLRKITVHFRGQRGAGTANWTRPDLLPPPSQPGTAGGN
jgi:hypothetical protein